VSGDEFQAIGLPTLKARWPNGERAETAEQEGSVHVWGRAIQLCICLFASVYLSVCITQCLCLSV